MRRPRDEENGDQELAELAALADGSLAPERRIALEARVAGSAELADRLAEQQRAVALARGSRDRGRSAACPARADRRETRRTSRASRTRGFVVIGAVATVAVAAVVGLSVLRSGSSSRALPGRARRHRIGTRRQRPGDAHQDILGLAGRARRERAATPRRGALLRSVAAERRRRAGAGRHLQRGPPRHALGWSATHGLHDADRHPRAGRRRSGALPARRCSSER